MKRDIESRKDIQIIVDSFYLKVRNDTLIGHIFEDIARVDWTTHLPKMYDFWETVLFGEKGFKGNPMEVHFKLNKTYPLEEKHFERWKELFDETVNERFEGTYAVLIKQKAASIAGLMLFKIKGGLINKPGK